jgi:hypothetical protein
LDFRVTFFRAIYFPSKEPEYLERLSSAIKYHCLSERTFVPHPENPRRPFRLPGGLGDKGVELAGLQRVHQPG